MVILYDDVACGTGAGCFRRVTGMLAPGRAAVRAAFVALVAMTLLACKQPEIEAGPATVPTATSFRSEDASVTFSSFPAWYFTSSAFSPSAPSAAPTGLGGEAETSAGLRLASVNSTLMPDPPVKRSVEPGRSSYGMASFYRHHSRTASGEAFNERDLTAAHRSLPFGTRLRVTSLATGRSVTVRVNDRGPYVSGRIVDLSYFAAEALGMVGRGVTKVKLDVVE